MGQALSGIRRRTPALLRIGSPLPGGRQTPHSSASGCARRRLQVPRGPAAPGLRQDLPGPGAGGAGAEPGHPLHPQRGGLPLERPHQAPAGTAGGRGGPGRAPGRPGPAHPAPRPQAHLGTCGFNVVPCPNRCSAKLSRRDLPEHLQHGCPKRRVKCEFCASDFTGEAFEGHQGTCPQESVYCENKCGARMMRRLLPQHGLAECPKRTQPCTYCAKEFVFDTIQNHQYQCPRYPVPCPNQCGTPSIAREDVPTHLKESCNTAMLLCPFKEAGCKHRCPKLAMGRHLEESTKAHLGMVCALVSRQRQEILELRRDVEELSVSSDGTLIWKIADYARKLQEAKARSNYEFFSPPFYTHKYGYKLQVSAFLNGNGSGESSHLSVYIRVLPGEYDNLLEWPFSYRVTFSLLDQSDPSLSKPQHITETFHPDPNWKNFQKPGASRSSLDESTLGFGYPKFISHEDIKKRNYVRDNAIFIKASVEIPQKILA
ncbi:TNF receptor-associated factor 4 [Apteryx rowi]|uniref:TNF receptor-associated factor 4 n=1 Tax=Apteryx rowi TaxID=308060 RepID=UPI000E1DE308|nr:TNF receptor-associated factor 4 [Apteryx rowi]